MKSTPELNNSMGEKVCFIEDVFFETITSCDLFLSKMLVKAKTMGGVICFFSTKWDFIMVAISQYIATFVRSRTCYESFAS